MPRDIPDVYIDSPTVIWLRDAQARVRRGWIKRNALTKRFSDDGYGFAYCAGGALTFDDNGQNLTYEKTSAVFTAATDMMHLAVVKLTRSSRDNMSIVKFNDNWQRTKADIDEAFEVAVELQIRLERRLPI